MRQKAYPSLHGPVHSPLPHGLCILTNIASPTCGWKKHIYIFVRNRIVRHISYKMASYRVINIKIGMCKRGEVWDLINRYILATSLSQAKTWFPLTNVVVFHIFSDLRCEMVVLLILLELMTTTVETCSHKYKLQNSYRTKGCIYKWLSVYHWEIIYLIISPFYLYASRLVFAYVLTWYTVCNLFCIINIDVMLMILPLDCVWNFSVRVIFF